MYQKKWTKKLSTCKTQSNLPILLKCTVFYSFAKRTKIKVPFDIMPSLLRAYINPKFSSLQMRKMVAIYCVLLKYLNRGSSSFTHTFNSSFAPKKYEHFWSPNWSFFYFYSIQLFSADATTCKYFNFGLFLVMKWWWNWFQIQDILAKL